jgi:transposase-like protein
MKPAEISRLLKEIQKVPVEEISKVKDAVAKREGDVESLLMLQERTESVKCCPHCGCVEIVKNGFKNGKQRFWCKGGCGATFNALTGTPLARLRMPERHIENARCMIEHLSIPRTAERLGVCRETAFRWRHRFMTLLAANPSGLSGVVEADETFVRESFKGKRSNMTRKSKKRGKKASKRGLSSQQIPVAFAVDRNTKSIIAEVVPSRSSVDIEPVLVPRLAKDSVLMTDGASAYKTIGRKHGFEVRTVPADKSHKTKGSVHINNVNNSHERLKSWLAPFRGVATKNLTAYLRWFRWMETHKNTPLAREFLKNAVGG